MKYLEKIIIIPFNKSNEKYFLNKHALYVTRQAHIIIIRSRFLSWASDIMKVRRKITTIV